MHRVDHAFYDLTVHQRDKAWGEVAELEKKVAGLESKAKAKGTS